MKIKYGYVLREVAGSYVVIPVGENAADFNGVISLNEVGAFLWDKLKDDTDENALLAAVTAEYDVDEMTARSDIAAFLSKVREQGLLKD